MYASWYELPAESPFRRLVIVGNLDRKTQSAALKLDKDALGISGVRNRFFDLWNNETEIPEAELSNIRIDGGSFLLLGIK